MRRTLIERARQFRREPTRSEALLWEAIRARRLGERFYRQRVIGPFIPDVVCLQARLVVEIDGPVHDEQRERDVERQSWLESRGYHVIRFSSAEVERDLPACLDRIRNALQPSKSTTTPEHP